MQTFDIGKRVFSEPIWYVLEILSSDLIKKSFLKPIWFIVGILTGGLLQFLRPRSEK